MSENLANIGEKILTNKTPETKEKGPNKYEKLAIKNKQKQEVLKKETFQTFDKYLTIENLKKYQKEKKENGWAMIDLNNHKITQNPNFQNLFLEYLKKNPEKLDFIVENGLYNCFGFCPNEETISKLKYEYITNKDKKVVKLLTQVGIPQAKAENLTSKVFSSTDCNPLNLKENIQKVLKEENIQIDPNKLNKLTDKIIYNTAKAKEVKTELEINKIIDDNTLRELLNYLGNYNLFLLLEDENKCENIIKSFLENHNETLSDKKLKNLTELVLQKLKLNWFNKQMKEIGSQINKKDIVEKVNFNNGDAQVPPEFKKDNIKLYSNLIIEHNNIGSFIISHLKKHKPSGAFGYFYNQAISWIENLLGNKLNKRNKTAKNAILWVRGKLEKLSDSRLLGKAAKYILKVTQPIFTRFLEEEYFLEQGKIFNTDTVWLENIKNPNELSRYQGEKANIPQAKGYVQVTSRTNFANILKQGNFENINSVGLTDYLYKAKIKYGDWGFALYHISKELGDKTFKEFIDFIKQNHPKNKKIKTAFTNFLNNNKDLLQAIENFSDFTQEDKVGDDIKHIAKNVNSTENNTKTNFFKGIAYEMNESIKEGKPDTQKATNILKYASKNYQELIQEAKVLPINDFFTKLIKKGINKKIINNLKSDNNEKVRKVGLILDTYLQLKKITGISIESPEFLQKFSKEIFLNPLAAQEELLKIISKNKNLSPEQKKEIASKVLNLGSQKIEKVDKFIDLVKNKDYEKAEQLFEEIKNDSLSYTLFTIGIKSAVSKGEISNKDAKKILDGNLNTMKATIKYIGNLTKKTQQTNNIAQKTITAKNPANKETYMRKYFQAEKDLAQSVAPEYQQEIYSSLYYSSYISPEQKKEIENICKQKNIKLENTSKSIFHQDNFSQKIDNVLTKNPDSFVKYTKTNGTITIQNPFANQDNLTNKEITALNLKEANEKFIQNMLESLGLYQVENLQFSKDSEKILKQFNIDITKPLKIENLQNFLKKFSFALLYQLDKNEKLSSIHKKYIKNFKEKFVLNPNDINNFTNFINFLNNNPDLLIKTGYYDFTSKTLYLQNFPFFDNPEFQKFKKSL